MELDRLVLAAEKPKYSEVGRSAGFALFAIGLVFILYTCGQMIFR